jgi:rubrerythrin
MGDTMENLAAAFAGESQANQRYRGSAKAADEEGMKMVARLFRAAAAAEHVHAQNHLKSMAGLGSTLENLQAAMEGEADEFKSMYPGFIEAARAEGNEDAEWTFDAAMQVEEIHHGLYGKAAESVKAGKDLPYDNIYVCQGCGNTVVGEAPEECPICGAPKSAFKYID